MTISPMLCPVVTVVRDKEIWSVLRTNQIAGFITMPSWEKRKSISEQIIYLITMYDCVHTCVCGRNCEQCKGPSFVANLYQFKEKNCIRTLQLVGDVYLLFPDRIRL